MPMTDQERNALVSLLCGFDHDDMGAFLGQHMLPGISAFSAPSKFIPAIAVDFAAWLDLHPDRMAAVFAALSTEFDAAAQAPTLAAAATRITAALAKAYAGPAHETRLASGVPIVNRAVLRDYLREAADDAGNAWSAVKVVSVTGERGLGRTHSWYLIKFVADSGVARAIKIDLVSATLANQTLRILFKQLIRELKITDAEYPTEEGATSGTLAARYAEELAGCIGRVTDDWARPVWLVFDSLDRSLGPEIKQFISLLSRARIDGAFGKCVIFLLGPDPACTPDDPTRLVLSEPLVAFTDDEIRDAATCLNALGSAHLAQTQLEDRIAQMSAMRAALPPGEFCKQVALRLVDLRVEVRA